MVRELMNPCGIVASEDEPLASRGMHDGPTVIGLFSNQKALPVAVGKSMTVLSLETSRLEME